MGAGPALPVKPLPTAPSALHIFGPGAILAAMGIGIGELFIWPRFVVLFGVGILWIGMLGVTIQYVVTSEMGRWEVATGESIFRGASRLGGKGVFMWMFFIYAIPLYIWAGWLATAGAVGQALTGWPWQWWGVISIVLILIALSVGTIVYEVVEKIETVIILFTIGAGTIVASLLTSPATVAKIMGGWFQVGFWHPDMSTAKWIPFILGAIAYMGPSGMQQMWYTLWLREDKVGMGSYVGRITGLVTKRVEEIPDHGYTFDANDPKEMEKWKAWRKWITVDAAVIFWFLTILVTTLFVIFALEAVRLNPKILALERTGATLPLLRGMADTFAVALGKWAWYAFLIAAFFEIWNTAFAVYDGYSRGQAEMVYMGSKAARKISAKWWYYIFLFSESVVAAIVIVGFKAPLQLIIIATMLAAPVMGMYCLVLAYTNYKLLPKPIRVNPVHLAVLIGGGLFYLGATAYALMLTGKPPSG